ncbi:unnamed protein product [Haemonchus placei]|uniref:Uncharacterized protein n=1 Tax=Haemonchus placei TaxID=6290 RepID=A0A3P7UX49_HAEPC|nr:unnamed protein product [Haemonchus placei]
MRLCLWINIAFVRLSIQFQTSVSFHNRRVTFSMSDLRETLSAADAFLFKEEAMTPIFCKPKLLPLKTITLQKLDDMQKEARNRARIEEVIKLVPPDPVPSTEAKADIWTAED